VVRPPGKLLRRKLRFRVLHRLHPRRTFGEAATTGEVIKDAEIASDLLPNAKSDSVMMASPNLLT